MEDYKGKQIYTEDFTAANDYRNTYLDSINSYLDGMITASFEKREQFMKPSEFAADPEKFRLEYIKMLGKPLTEYKKTLPSYEKNFVASDDMCDIYRMLIETMPGFKFYGMLMIPKGLSGKAPLVICQHGGGGTPELCSDMHGKNNYSHMTRRILERNVVVFAPQLMLWNSANYEIKYNRGETDARLKAVGSSVTALEIYNIKKSIDCLEEMDFIDKEKIGMTGLSYGGFFTLYTMAADTRIKSGYSCGCFSDRTLRCFQDWTWENSYNKFCDAEIAGLCAPRKLYLQIGKTDAVFDYNGSVKEFDRVPKYYEAFGKAENACFDLWEGGHTVRDTDDGHNFFFKALLD